MLHPHNLYLAMWLNLGIVGLVSFIYIIAATVSRFFVGFKGVLDEKLFGTLKLRLILFAMLLIVLIHGLFDTPFFKNDLALLFWVIIGSIYVCRD